MMTVGLVGGVSWVSTVEYYTYINQGVNQALGRNHSAQINMVSVDFEDVCVRNDRNDHEGIFRIMLAASQKLAAMGSDFVVLCANTMHMHADRIQAELPVPILHIGEVTAEAVAAAGIKKVALLGTKYVMQGDFYTSKLRAQGLEPMTPPLPDQEFIHQAIYRQLTRNIFRPETRHAFIQVVEALQSDGAEAVILGCTEIPLLLKPGDLAIPAFDTTRLHAQAAVHRLLADRSR